MTIKETQPVSPDDARETDKTNQARRIGGSLVWSQIGRALDNGIGFVFAVVVVRLLGPQDYAVYAVAWGIIGVATLVASLGYSETLTRYLPTFAFSGAKTAATFVRRLIAERTLIGLLIALVVWVGVEPIAAWTHTPALRPVIGLVALLIVTQSVWDLLVAYYNATLRMRDHTAVRTVGQAASLIIALGLFGIWGVQIWVPFCAVLTSYLISIVLYLLGARSQLTVPSEPIALDTARRFGGYVWLTNLATFGLANQVDVLLIAALLQDSSQVSFYNVAILLLSRLYSVLTGWTATLMPAAAEAHTLRGDNGLVRSFDLYMKVNLAVLVPPFIFVAAFAHPVIVTLFGDAFAPAGSLLWIYALFSLASTFAGANVCHPILYVANRQRTLLGLRIIAGALNIALDVLLIPLLGAAGAVIATSVSNLTTHAVELALLRRATHATYPLAVAAKFLAASLLAVIPAVFIPNAGWVPLISSAILFGAIFAVAIWRMHPLATNDYAALTTALPGLRPVLRWFAAA
jgi:O-antigen/teichoic acid export membrane protein